MVLILSNSTDDTASEVIKWLRSIGEEVLRINGDEKNVTLEKIDFGTKELIIKIDENFYNLNDFNSIWYRKTGFSFFVEGLTKDLINKISNQDIELESSITSNLTNEIKIVVDYLHHVLEEKNSLGSRFNSNPNKLIILRKAEELGMQIPRTKIITNIVDLKKFKKECKTGVITKAISEGIYTFSENRAYYSYTEEIDDTLSNQIKNKKFFPSLIQEKIDKAYELRVFFIKDEYFTMAIFSQKDKQTEVDYRKYNNEKPNRNTPYILKTMVKNKLMKLMDYFGFDTGSIDLVVDKKGRYFFLEVNPVGQFGMTSRPCNYYLEKRVAECLI